MTSVKENGTRYTYDNLGQLTREDNAYAGKTYVYTYDNGGNILTKKTYAYMTGSVGTAQSTVNYGYGNSNWKDQLTSYNMFLCSPFRSLIGRIRGCDQLHVPLYIGATVFVLGAVFFAIYNPFAAKKAANVE